jgi:hypothetical protein
MSYYVCVKCRKTWGIDNGDPDLVPSHGLCIECLRESLIPLYRKRQLREGNFDCFGKAEYYCDQDKCKYRKLCVKEKQ